jgi:glycosyltransferase involved in cell wall biosynthesis
MLSRWALNRSAWKKRIFWALVQGTAVRRASCFHATAEREYEDIRSAGLRRQPVCVIPNGIDVMEMKPEPVTQSRILLFLGRIHPVKGVDILLRAWAAVERSFPEWELRIAGPDNNGYLPKMQSLAEGLGLKRVCFCGPLYGQAKQVAYREAELFVLPSHTENFGVTVAESLAAGTPAIVTKGAPWSGLEEHRAGWWIDIGIDPLVACLEEAMSLSRNELISMGRFGRDWMIRDNSWPRIGQMMHLTYKWLVFGGETPAWVRLD